MLAAQTCPMDEGPSSKSGCGFFHPRDNIDLSVELSRSTKNFKKKYYLELTAATFLIIDYNEESMDIACEWQRCIGDTINLVSPLRCGASGTRGSGDN